MISHNAVDYMYRFNCGELSNKFATENTTYTYSFPDKDHSKRVHSFLDVLYIVIILVTW